VLVEISSHGIRPMEELACECLIDHNSMLRIRTVHITERSARKHPNLQSIEVAGSDIYLVCGNLPSRLLAVAEGDCIEQSTLIRQGQSDGGVLHTGDVSHAGDALIEKLPESRGVVVPDIIQRRLSRDHSVWVETRRHGFKMDKR